jgi:putative intracellular protease/amidase/uncharacterized protein (DUF2267 family)
MPALLVVITGADQWTLNDGSAHPTGFWAEELIAPMRVFDEAGIEVTIATPGGVRPTVDEASLSADAVGGEESTRLRGELDALADRLATPTALEDVSPADYDGVFIPGGHGPMEDLAVSPELGRLLVTMVDADKVVAAVCHGPAALLPAVRDDGAWAFAGRDLAGFTNDEEGQAGLADRAPWLLEDRMREAGGSLSTGPAWQPFSVVDGNVVTGQNPASSEEVARHAVERLNGGRGKRSQVEVLDTDHVALAKDVAEATGLAGEDVERAIEATLVTLGETISEGEAEDLARHLPDSLGPMIRQRGPAEPIDAEEFFRRIADREGTDPQTAEQHARPVVAALARRAGRKEFHDMMSQLPKALRERLAPDAG